MNCRKIQNKLSAYLDCEITENDVKAIEEHLQHCRQCEKRLQSLKNTWEIVGILPDPEPVPYFYTRLKRRMASQEKEEALTWIDRVLIPASAVVALALGLLVGNIVGRNGDMRYQSPILEEEVVDSLQLDNFDDFPNASLGDALFTMAVRE
jgi:predicted anti-sigma-YlaC factor YlaD